MPNTADYLQQLRDDRDDFADFLDNNGVPATHSDTITALVAKLPNLPIGGGAYGGVAVIPIQSIAEALPTNTTVTV